MNAPHSPSLLASVPMAPSDPILGVTEAFVADPNPRKVNLGVGVYYDDAGKIPLLECVRHAESERLKNVPSRGYLPIDGLAAYDRAVRELVFGSQQDNIVTVQALGGTGGLEADGYAARLFAGAMTPVFLSSSFSKSFSLYGERVGALSVASASAEEASRVLSQLKRVVRSNYSNPPTHGGQIVASVLASPQLRSLWDRELGAMRERIKAMRKQLVEKIHARAPGADFSFVLAQRGMFSYSGLSKAQVQRLRAEYSIYAIDTGRICVAALNSKNVDYVADAIAKVIE